MTLSTREVNFINLMNNKQNKILWEEEAETTIASNYTLGILI